MIGHVAVSGHLQARLLGLLAAPNDVAQALAAVPSLADRSFHHRQRPEMAAL